MNGRPWTKGDLAVVRRLYSDTMTEEIAALLGRSVRAVYGAAWSMAVSKTATFMKRLAARSKLPVAGRPFRFPKGHAPHNKGAKGWQAGGRSGETRFKKGNVSKRWDPEMFCVGALRINGDGYIDMKVKEGSRSWRALHVILWEDAHGPVPKGYNIQFRDGDRMNVMIENLHLVSHAENMRRNSIHNLPPDLKHTIVVLGQLKRRIREKQNGRSAQSPV